MNRSLDEIEFSNVVEKFHFLYCIEDSIFPEGLEDEIKWFTSQLRAFESIIRYSHAHRALYRLDASSIKTATDIANDVQSIIDEFIVKTARQRTRWGGSFKKFVFFFNDFRAREVAIKKLEYLIINANSSAYLFQVAQGTVETHAGTWIRERAPTTSALLYDVLGREEDTRVIQEMLMSEDKRFQVISLVGMPGSGKTTVARKIYNNGQIKSHFNFLAWVSYGGSEIIEMAFALEPNGRNKLDIYDISRNKRYLIVIDDFVTLKDWDRAEELLSRDTFNGSRILLTTRNEKLAFDAIRNHKEISPSPYQLGPIHDAESWQWFTKKVCPSPLLPKLESIGKEIVKKCYGLPLAIEHLVDHLSTKEMNSGEWLKVLESVSKHLNNDLTPWVNIIDMIIKDLPSNLKRCLFYFAFFPKNSTISVRRLIALWVAEGFIEKKSNHETLEYTAKKYLQELIDLNMVQITKWRSDGRPKRCYLVCYLREHLITRVKQANNTSSVGSKSRTSAVVCRLADHHLEDNSTVIASLDSHRLLLSFLSFDYRESFAPGEQIKNFLYGGINKGCFQLLRVLDLEGVYKPVLPKELGRLIQLKYFGLRWTCLDTLPSFIGYLTNLQTLDVKHTYINSLPNSVWKLQKLRHLYLNESHLDSFVHLPNVGYLENLQTLSGIFVDEESPLEEGLERIRKLTRLGVSCYLTSTSQQNAMAKWISKLDCLQSLRLRSKNQLGQPSDVRLMPFSNHMHLYDLHLFGRIEKLLEVHEFPLNLTQFTLSASKLEEDPMPTLERLSNLCNLKLSYDSYIGKHMVCTSSGFPRLHVLEIWKLEKLEKWTIEKGAMPVLKRLEIRSCKNLEMPSVGLEQILTLQELKLTNMPQKFTKKVKEDIDKGWYKKVGIHFDTWNGLNSSVAESSSSSSSSLSSSSSYFGTLLLLYMLLGRLPSSPTKHTRVKGIPALTYQK